MQTDRKALFQKKEATIPFQLRLAYLQGLQFFSVQGSTSKFFLNTVCCIRQALNNKTNYTAWGSQDQVLGRTTGKVHQ